MTQPRSAIVSLETTPYYHCITRCVRRAFLCGDDHYSGKNFDHRKPWFIKRLKLLADVFAIDIAAYAIMSNHYHLVLHIDQTRSNRWTQDEVIQRWLSLYKGPEIVHCYLRQEPQSDAEKIMLKQQVEVWRKRLCNLSWFMRCLNEFVARKANKEDECKGRFWESRFKSQALIDETALLSCMTYVDLNPIRAGLSQDLSSSEFTSVKERILQIKGEQKKSIPRLMPFSESIQQESLFSAIPFALKDYIELVDWTGRAIRHDKRGYIKKEMPSLIPALGLNDEQWQHLALEIQKQSISMLHGLERLVALEKRTTKIRVL